MCDSKPIPQQKSRARNVEEQIRMEHPPWRYTTTDAKDAKGTEYQSGEFGEDSLRCST